MEESRKIILAIDDMAVILTSVRNVLQDEYDVRLAKSANMALEMLNQFKADLILLDIEMPEISGFEFAALLRKNPENKDIPVVFLTSHANSQLIEAALNFGAKGYIIKPFTPEALTKRVKAALEET
jgi:putative two-component system response regulator